MRKKLAFLLMMSLLVASCENPEGGDLSDSPSDVAAVGDQLGGDSSVSPDDVESTPISAPPPEPISNVPSLALTFKTNVQYLTGFDYSDEVKYDKAVALVKKVVATEAFKNRVLDHYYNGTKSFANNNGLSNQQIYQSVLDAAEKLTPTKNNTLDVGVKLYYENNSVVGWTSTSITYINVNTKFFDQYAINSIAGNLFHEWLHKLGYGHDSTATARRPYSVPYAIGYIIRDIGKNFL